MVRMLIFLMALLPLPLQATPSVVTPYPLLADCAQIVAGDDIDVRLLPSRDVHSFAPTASQLAEFSRADLILLLGKEMESNWIDDLRDSIGQSTEIFLVGDALPDLAADGGHAAVSTIHDHGRIDPHWWHSLENWQSAADWMADEFSEIDPQHETNYRRRAAVFAEELETLRRNYRRRFARIPRQQRVLAVPHAAFGYLCAEFNLEQVPLLGLNGNGELPARHLEQCVTLVQQHQVPALFAEEGAPRRGIEQLSRSTGIPLAGNLLADGDERAELTVREFLEHNLETIASGLEGSEANEGN